MPATSSYLNKSPRSLAQAQADRSLDWGHQATHPEYDMLRGEPGSPRWIACLGLTDEEVRKRDQEERPRMGSWMEQMAKERGK